MTSDAPPPGRLFSGTEGLTAEHHYVQVAGSTTSYWEQGSGEPVVLIHGSGRGVTAAANWYANLDALGSRYRVLAPELPGFGDSDPTPDGVYGIASWCTHLVGFLDAVGVEEAHLVGNSLGAWVACELAHTAGDRVRRLVLMGTGGTPESMPKQPRRAGGPPPTRDQMRTVLTRFVVDPRLVTDDLLDHRLEYATRPDAEETFAATLAARDRDRVEHPLSPDLAASIHHETLVLHGHQDQIIPVESSWALARALPAAHLTVFTDCGHWTQIESARRFNLYVDDFLHHGLDQ